MEATKWLKPSVSGSRYTVTPISRPVVKGTSIFFGGADRQCLSFGSFQRQRSAGARFFSSWLRTNDGSRQTPIRIKLRPNDGLRPGGLAAPEERWYRTVSKRTAQWLWLPASRRQSPDGLRCGRSRSQQLVTAVRRPIQRSRLQSQSPYLACRTVVVRQAKQRVTSNGLPSFRM